jgi:hypothetical protein
MNTINKLVDIIKEIQAQHNIDVAYAIGNPHDNYTYKIYMPNWNIQMLPWELLKIDIRHDIVFHFINRKEAPAVSILLHSDEALEHVHSRSTVRSKIFGI